MNFQIWLQLPKQSTAFFLPAYFFLSKIDT